jgi:hypothetical protein
VDKEVDRPIWQVKQRWARRSDYARVKTFDFSNFQGPKNFFENQKFYPSGKKPTGPTLLNLPDWSGGFLTIALYSGSFFPHSRETDYL